MCTHVYVCLACLHGWVDVRGNGSRCPAFFGGREGHQVDRMVAADRASTMNGASTSPLTTLRIPATVSFPEVEDGAYIVVLRACRIAGVCCHPKANGLRLCGGV